MFNQVNRRDRYMTQRTLKNTSNFLAFPFFFQTLTQELNVYKTNTYRMLSSEKTDHIYPTYAVGKQMMKNKKSIQYCT